MGGWATWKGSSDSNPFSMGQEVSQQLHSSDEFRSSQAAFANFWARISASAMEIQAIAGWFGDVPLPVWATILPLFACIEVCLIGWILRRCCCRARGHKLDMGKEDAEPEDNILEDNELSNEEMSAVNSVAHEVGNPSTERDIVSAISGAASAKVDAHDSTASDRPSTPKAGGA